MRGVFKTTDGGKTWAHVLKISPKTGVNDLAMDPKDPNILYAGAWQRQRRKWNDPRVEVGFSEGVSSTTDAGKRNRLTRACRIGVLGRIGLRRAIESQRLRLHRQLRVRRPAARRRDAARTPAGARPDVSSKGTRSIGPTTRARAGR
jgi:hypothetical protein